MRETTCGAQELSCQYSQIKERERMDRKGERGKEKKGQKKQREVRRALVER